jgi:hypothetical protein
LQTLDHALDLLSGFLGPPGQAAHLVGHHCETASLLACASGLDGRVQGQQVGLLGDATDHVEDAADAFAVLLEFVYYRCRLLDFRGQAGDLRLRLGQH